MFFFYFRNVCVCTHAHIRTYTYDMTLSILSVGPEVVHLHSYVENRGVLLYSSLLYFLQSGSLGTDMHVAENMKSTTWTVAVLAS